MQNNKLIFQIFFYFMFPHLIFVMVESSSLTFGLAISIVIIFLSHHTPLKIYAVKNNVKYFGIFILVVGVQFVLNLNSVTEKLVLSLLCIIFFPLALSSMVHQLNQLSRDELELLSGKLVIGALTVGYFGLIFQINFTNYAHLEKPVFPFSEESHYAIFLTHFLVWKAFLTKGKVFYFMYVAALGLGFLYPNLTLIAGSTFAFLLFLIVRKQFRLIFIILCLLPISVFYQNSVDLVTEFKFFNYFWERVNILSTNNNNISTLVFLQGWVFVTDSLAENPILGWGFQLLGSDVKHLNDYSLTIQNLTADGNYRNLSDGSFLAAKIVSEFGLFGILIVTILVSMNVKNLLSTYRYNIKPTALTLISASIFIELFVRGYGYFSPGFIFLLSAVLSTPKMKPS